MDKMDQERKTTEKKGTKKQLRRLKLYKKPEILLDLELETRAGSPLSPFDNPFDLDNLS